MKTYLYSVIFFIAFTSCSHFSQKKNWIKAKPEILKEGSDFQIPISAKANAYTENLQFNDGLFLSTNIHNNSVSIFDYNGQVLLHKELDTMLDNRKIKVEGAWFTSLDSVFISDESHLNTLIQLTDTGRSIVFKQLVPRESSVNQLKPTLRVSTKQIPVIIKNAIYFSGLVGSEKKGLMPNQRPVIGKIYRNTVTYIGRYPDEYIGRDWGSFFFKEVYMTALVDHLIYFNFPASSSIGILDTKTDSFYFKKIEPSLGDLVKPIIVNAFDSSCKNPNIDADHFYAQHSFGPIIYDKYRKLFYRFLLKPTDEKYLKKEHMGPQSKYLLVYDKSFNLLGYNELPENLTHFNFFVNSKSLNIQKIVIGDGNNMHFVPFY